MTILTHVADSGERGQSREVVEAMLLGVSPVEIRLAAMERDGMVREEAGSLVSAGGLNRISGKAVFLVVASIFEELRWGVIGRQTPEE